MNIRFFLKSRTPGSGRGEGSLPSGDFALTRICGRFRVTTTKIREQSMAFLVGPQDYMDPSPVLEKHGIRDFTKC